jgi:ATP/maltotriose-dependent transcriptional regulator MalT
VEPAVRSGIADAPVAPGAGGVVFRAALVGRLGAAGRVTEVSAPPGSGKTLLLRSWIADPALAGRAAWGFRCSRRSVTRSGGQPDLPVNTVRTHMRHVYEKLGTHRCQEAVDRARALGLLAPSTLRT